MLHPHLQRGFVHRQLERMEEHLAALPSGFRTRDGEEVPDSLVAQVRTAVSDARAEATPGAEGGAYYGRHPIASLTQSALHRRLAHKRERGEVEHDDERMGDPYTTEDILWVVEIVVGLARRAWLGRHPFVDEPARAELPDRVRLILFADWGTGQEGAQHVSRYAREQIEGSECPVHVVHLGDIYYSGLPSEVRDNALALWPVAAERAGDVGSWALNGNHDMYCGGEGLFDVLLADPRFARQRAGGGPATSWLSLTSPSWHVIGLDTAWNDQLPFGWKLGHLCGGQADHVARCARDASRRLLLLSHHQLFTVHDDDDVGSRIAAALAPVLGDRGVDAWFWGHEHDCLGYESHDGVGAARVIGHGGVPVIVPPQAPAVPSHVRWQYRDFRIGADGEHWARHGFAIVDLDGQDMTVRYIDDDGHEVAVSDGKGGETKMERI